MTLFCGRKDVPLFESKAGNSVLNLAFFSTVGLRSMRCKTASRGSNNTQYLKAFIKAHLPETVTSG